MPTSQRAVLFASLTAGIFIVRPLGNVKVESTALIG